MNGENRRNAGIATVLDHEDEEFKKRYHRRVRAQKGEFLFESIRLGMERDGWHPYHHNVWGALSSWYVKKGLVTKVGERKSADPRAHARTQPVFVLAKA